MTRSVTVRVGLLALAVACIATAASATLAFGDVPGTRPAGPGPLLPATTHALQPYYSDSGKLSLSVDGAGTNAASTTIDVQKNVAGATVRKAFLFAASTGFSGYTPVDGDVALDGTPISWIPGDTISTGIGSANVAADVTALVKAKVDPAPAGLVSFTVAEPNGSFSMDGEVLAVILDDPSVANAGSVILLYGAQQPGGDTFNVGLADPVDLSDPNFALDLSLGISFGFQPSGQYSEITVNSQPLTSSAGGQDDGVAANGALITAGGIGDLNDNPPNPTATDLSCVGAFGPAPRCDDELYNLLPFVNNGDTSLAFTTRNPSNDDNVFFGALNVRSNAAVVGKGVVLSPTEATNNIGEQHTVTATVQDDNGDPVSGVTVHFEVTSGPNAGLTGDAVTDANGQAQFTYSSSSTGTDHIEASFTDGSGLHTSNEVTKTWESTIGPPATLSLSPETATNTAGDQHCVTAHVEDANGNPTPSITVPFSVSGANSAGGSGTTDAGGDATFCYTGTTAGNDTITAFADTNANTTDDGASEPDDTAAKTYVAAAPQTLDLTPPSATNTVGSQHCVTAHVEDVYGNPASGITVRFSTSGAKTTSGSATTDANGDSTYCYTGPGLPGSDTITAFADTDSSGGQGAGEPSDTATKQWVPPATSVRCKVTYGGRILAANGDLGTFGGNAMSPAGVPRGEEQFQDHGPATRMDVHSLQIDAVVCNATNTKASIYGQAAIDGTGSHVFRIDLHDVQEPGRGVDTYRLRLDTGYDTGHQTLKGGNVQIHNG